MNYTPQKVPGASVKGEPGASDAAAPGQGGRKDLGQSQQQAPPDSIPDKREGTRAGGRRLGGCFKDERENRDLIWEGKKFFNRNQNDKIWV